MRILVAVGRQHFGARRAFGIRRAQPEVVRKVDHRSVVTIAQSLVGDATVSDLVIMQSHVMKRSPLVLPVLFAIACGSSGLSPAAARIREGDESDLSDCTFIQKVRGVTSELDSNAETHARNSAREQAAKLGATHIRWIIPCCTSVEAEAYHCDVPE